MRLDTLAGVMVFLLLAPAAAGLLLWVLYLLLAPFVAAGHALRPKTRRVWDGDRGCYIEIPR